MLDNEIRSWPPIDYKQYPRRDRPDRRRRPDHRPRSARRRRRTSRSCSRRARCRCKFVTLERTDVSATLGKDSLRQARNAAIGGLIVVALFLLLLYRFLGLVAVIGLAIYAAFMYGAILLFGVTLTLPGFAGLILTIGVAADANVVVFERIKEEARAGKSVRAAIAAGYAKGFRTIVDANVVTVITALILFAVATASVKGFALMLLIGTVDLADHRGRRDARDARPARRLPLVREPALHGRAPTQREPLPADRLHAAAASSGSRSRASSIVDQRRARSACAGLNLGIDFKGGVQITFTTPKPTSLDDRARADGRRSAAATRSSRAAASRRTATSTRTSRSG